MKTIHAALRPVAVILCVAGMSAAAGGATQARPAVAATPAGPPATAVATQAPPKSPVKPVTKQKAPAVAKPLRPRSAVDLPCITTMKPGTPPYSTTGFILEAWNEFSAPIPAGTQLHVSYTIEFDDSIGLPSQPMRRIHALASDLMPKQAVEVGSLYQGPYVKPLDCQSWFNGGFPDLQVTEATLSSGQLRLLVRNTANFASADASVARVRLMRCSQIALGSIDVAVPAIPPQTTVTVLSKVMLPAGFEYFDAVADINGTLRESNEANNGFTGVGVCVR